MHKEQQYVHQNAFGFSRKCTCANAVHVHFGNIALLLSHSQLRDFSVFVSETAMSETCCENTNDRNIYLPTRDMALMFALSYSELILLDEILSQTVLTIEIDNLLSN
jgi:hypothetical protein